MALDAMPSAPISSDNYMYGASLHKRLQELANGNVVMTRPYLERFSFEHVM